jgi:hypothetical protein
MAFWPVVNSMIIKVSHLPLFGDNGGGSRAAFDKAAALG